MSDWTTLTGAMLQGSWLGPLMFLVLTNDLSAACQVHKFVDDTTLTEVLGVDQPSRIQDNLDDIVTQSAASLMNTNAKKTKEMRLRARARKQQYQDLTLEGNIIENVKSYKLLGIHVTESLKWDVHITVMLSKAFKHIHFLKQLRRVGVSTADLVTYCNSVIRSVLEYACPVWHSSLTTCRAVTANRETAETCISVHFWRR